MNGVQTRNNGAVLGLLPCTWSWLLLLLLTGGMFLVAEQGWGGPRIVLVLLAAALLKGRLIVDHFMGLRRVRLCWRLLVLGYLIVVIGLIGTAYWLALK